MASRKTHRRGRSPWRGVVALGLVMVVVGLAVWFIWGRPEQAPAQVTEPEPTPGASSSSPAEVVEGRELPEATPAPPQPGDPLWIRIPAIGVDSPVVAILAPGGVLTPPADPQTLGWWADGARPGDEVGSALMTGHTVSTGGGALDDLEELEDGDAVRVGSPGLRTVYVVSDVEIYDKGELARRAEELFDQQADGRLVLITCEDWNGSEYLSNVVVTATPV